MDRAVRTWIEETNEASVDNAEALRSFKLTYTIYGCMLLLPATSFDALKVKGGALQHDPGFVRFHELICKHLKVTHIAMTKPIPALRGEESTKNIIRSPVNFTPLYGNFGPETASSPPTAADFDAAFWVTAKQNGIYQTWAPRWTMFSRGNISEKARLLSLASVTEAVEQGKADGKGCSAVDLYSGIGYFAFSYLKADTEKVLCWDLNLWSIEGLKRGAKANKWPVASSSDCDPIEHMARAGARLLVFNESNEHALHRIKHIRNLIPPIRHVNCGLLPTSRGSWQTVFQIMDAELGGWVHVHENFAVSEIGQKSEEVRRAFQQMMVSEGRTGTIKVETVNRLKSYAPGVMHCVIDLHIPANLQTACS